MNAHDHAYPMQTSLLGRVALAGAQLAAAAQPAALPSPRPAPRLAPGQVWKLNGAYVEIAGVGPKLVHYRVVKQPGQKAFTRVLKSDAFEHFLKESGANLLD